MRKSVISMEKVLTFFGKIYCNFGKIMLYFKCVMCVISEYFMAFFILKGEIFLKKQDFKRQLAAIMALAVTFSSVPPVWSDEISFITDDDVTLNSISTIGMETNA